MTVDSTLLYQSLGDTGDEPYIVTGPVIGLVTDSTARILIETSEGCSVTCKLSPSKKNACVVSKALGFEGRVPACFDFQNLYPDTHYRVTLSIPCPGLLRSGFSTLPKHWSLKSCPARLGFVTGNDTRYYREKISNHEDLWKPLAKLALKGDLDYLIHIGNNVYCDNTGDNSFSLSDGSSLTGGSRNRWHEALQLLAGHPPNKWTTKYAQIVDLFRDSYREAWNVPAVKQTLANVPNLMHLGDREIQANFGERLWDRDPYCVEYYVACCAYEAYNQYQRSLFESYDALVASPYSCTSTVRQAFHLHALGDIGFLFLDTRAVSVFHERAGTSRVELDDDTVGFELLGLRQWESIIKSLEPLNGYFAQCKLVVVVTDPPLAFTGLDTRANCGSGAKNDDGLQLCRNWQAHPAETSRLLSALFSWRANRPGAREVCIISGSNGRPCCAEIVDNRFAELLDFRLDRMKQLTLAPIASSPVKFRGHKFLQGSVFEIAPHHQFKIYGETKLQRQAGIMDVYPDYLDDRPDFGVVTRYKVKVLASNVSGIVPLKPWTNHDRQRAAFRGTFLGLCDPAVKNRVVLQPPPGHLRIIDKHNTIVSTHGGSDEDEGSSISSGTYGASSEQKLAARLSITSAEAAPRRSVAGSTRHSKDRSTTPNALAPTQPSSRRWSQGPFFNDSLACPLSRRIAGSC